jgi:hypothetical protein
MARTTSSIFLFLRRLRRPLLVLIASYAVCTLGMVLIPGVDAEGRTVHLDFLHAFYIISYTGSTIGYGEIPNAFTPAQRVWMTFTMYVAVTAWLYSIGSIIATLTDPGFRRLILERRFAAQVRGIGQPFYLVCGYGHTLAGGARAAALRVRRRRLDDAQERLDELACSISAPSSRRSAATSPSPTCSSRRVSRAGVASASLAWRPADDANLAVAMGARLLNPDVPAIGAASRRTPPHMASFGNAPHRPSLSAFAERVGLTNRPRARDVIYEACPAAIARGCEAHDPASRPLGGLRPRPLRRSPRPATGRRRQRGDGDRIEPGASAGRRGDRPRHRSGDLARGRHRHAVGIVAGTDHGINNLSIIVTAQELQPTIFTIAREVVRDQQLLFLNAGLDLRVNLAYLAASEAVELLRNPLLPMFLDQLMRCDEGWAAALLRRLTDTIGDYSPDTWVVALTPESAPALLRASTTWPATSLDLLLRDPRDRSRMLAAVPLLVRRGKDTTLLPDDRFVLRPGDQLLFCGRMEAQKRMHWARRDIDVLSYIATGVERPSGWVWQRRAGRSA